MLAFITNFAPHYRKDIFTLMDKELDIDFYFGDKVDDIKKLDYSLFNRKVTEVQNKSLGALKWQTNIIKLAFSRVYDKYLITGEPLSISTWIISILARLLGKKVIFWTHGWYGRESFFKKVLKKVFFRLANGVLLYGNYAKDLMINEGFDSNKLKVVHNSLAYSNQLLLRNSQNPSDIYVKHFNNTYPVLIFLGRLTEVKQLDMIVDALFLLKKRDKFFNLVFVGDGSERMKLESLVNERSLYSQVWFYGASYDEKQNAELIYNADLCVAPGNVGLTAIHSMMFGVPVITHDDFKNQMPEFEAIKKGKTGDFFEYKNVDSLALKIEEWFISNMSLREQNRNDCFAEIDSFWNPQFQLDVIMTSLSLL